MRLLMGLGMPPYSRAGTTPVNLLPNTWKFVTFFHADKEAGRLPVRELVPTLKNSMSTNALTAADTVPRRLESNSRLRRRGEAGRSREKGRGVSARLSASAPPARHAAAGACAHMAVMEEPVQPTASQLLPHGSCFEQPWPK